MGFDIVTASRHALCVKVSYGTMEHVAMIRKESAPGGRQDAQGHGTMGVTRCDSV
jgi:hypothetical protein